MITVNKARKWIEQAMDRTRELAQDEEQGERAELRLEAMLMEISDFPGGAEMEMSEVLALLALDAEAGK